MRSLCLVLILLSALARADNIIAVGDVTGWTTLQGDGPFDEVIEAFAKDNTEVSVHRFPTARAVQEVKSGNAVCFYGGDGDSFEQYFGHPAISSRPVTQATWRIITANDRPVVSQPEQLFDMSIAVARGTPITGTTMGYDVALFDLVEVINSGTAVKMVSARRVDAAMISVNDDDPPFRDVHYDPHFAMATIQRGLNCDRDNSASANIIQSFDDFLERWKLTQKQY